jgi:hypothetical protein
MGYVEFLPAAPWMRIDRATMAAFTHVARTLAGGRYFRFGSNHGRSLRSKADAGRNVC